MRELTLRLKGSETEIAPEVLRIRDTREPIIVKYELANDWRYYEGYDVIFRNGIYFQRVKLNKELSCEIPSELLEERTPDKEITAELLGIMYTSNGDCALGLRRSRKERIIIIQ